ncbi:hypothetical protein PENDEC_c004G00965 [Penicillium decumbens]|uniref:Uncharacterized protein n=1 Tax=Penicillium decumbens TaxID=69771 RepID=A0A1V6PI25_PENDC|nr:hypothetical protein PENDEC_c004G00965 [Penicillium decumbens]
MALKAPRFKLELFPPYIFRQAGYESDGGDETDDKTKKARQILPTLSQMSQTTEKPNQPPASSSPPLPISPPPLPYNEELPSQLDTNGGPSQGPQLQARPSTLQ